jgi:hypothetical protein
VTLVEIGDAEFSAELSGSPRRTWPWSPLDHALFFEAAATLRPKVTAVIHPLDWPRPPRADAAEKAMHDQASEFLANALRRAELPLLGATLGFADDPGAAPPPVPSPPLTRVAGDRGAIPEFSAAALPAEAFRFAALVAGTNLPATRPLDRVPLLYRFRGDVIPSFALACAMLSRGLTPDDVSVTLGSHVTLGKGAAVPVDASGALRLDPRIPFARIGYDDLLVAAQPGARPSAAAGSIANGIAILGRTDRAAATATLASGRRVAPAEAWALAVASLERGRFARPAPPWVAWALVGLSVAACPWIARLRKSGALFVATLAFLAYLLDALALFAIHSIALPLVAPAGALAAATIFACATAPRPPKSGAP